MEPRFVIGIDLGTTNTVVSYIDIQAAGEGDEDALEVHNFEVTQLDKGGDEVELESLPSFGYMVGPHDNLETDNDYVVGSYARSRGSEVPGRLVAAAKSWLSQSAVDRLQPVLPLEAPEDVEKVSPVEATARILKHVRLAWNWHFVPDDPDWAMENQEVFNIMIEAMSPDLASASGASASSSTTRCP